MATDPHLSDAQIADVSMKVYDSDRQHLADFREEALKKALTEASALATAQSERLAQADAAHREKSDEARRLRAERFAGQCDIQPQMSRVCERGVSGCITKHAQLAATVAAQAERIAQLETALAELRKIVPVPQAMRHLTHLEKCASNPDAYPYSWRESDRATCDCGLSTLMTALAASRPSGSAEPTP